MTKLAILQSGFINFNEEDLVKGVIVNDPFVDIALNKDHLKNKNQFFYSPVANELYKQWSADPGLIRDFNFREKILKAAKKLFNTKSFGESSNIQVWFNYQAQSPFLSNYHIKFIKETIEYVLYGTLRTIENVQWIRLLDCGNSVKNTSLTVDQFFTDKFNKESKQKTNSLPNSGSAVSDFLTYWTSNQNGFEDLVICLFVIFGVRSNITELSDNNPR